MTVLLCCRSDAVGRSSSLVTGTQTDRRGQMLGPEAESDQQTVMKMKNNRTTSDDDDNDDEVGQSETNSSRTISHPHPRTSQFRLRSRSSINLTAGSDYDIKSVRDDKGPSVDGTVPDVELSQLDSQNTGNLANSSQLDSEDGHRGSLTTDNKFDVRQNMMGLNRLRNVVVRVTKDNSTTPSSGRKFGNWLGDLMKVGNIVRAGNDSATTSDSRDKNSYKLNVSGDETATKLSDGMTIYGNKSLDVKNSTGRYEERDVIDDDVGKNETGGMKYVLKPRVLDKNQETRVGHEDKAVDLSEISVNSIDRRNIATMVSVSRS